MGILIGRLPALRPANHGGVAQGLAVFAGEDGQYAYALVRADGADISPLVKGLNKTLNAL